jgi:hypothetical protein
MRTLSALMIAAVFLMAAPASAAETGIALLDRVRILTAPELAGRGSGTPGGRAAAETVAVWFERAGLEPAFDGAWLQEFALEGEGFSGEDLTRFVVVGAHHDHLGKVDPAAEAIPGPGEYYPGANDNASGISILAGLAEASINFPEARSLMYVAFGGEEVGLQGSSYLVDHLPVPADSIDAMINLDTVGQMNDEKLHVSGVGTAEVFARLVEQAASGGPAVAVSQGGWSGSDHMVFNTREIPVLFLFGGAYPQYNRPADTADSLDPSALAAVAGFAERLVALAVSEPDKFSWVMVGEKELRPDDGEGQDRRTWLGTLPDFTEGETGYKLAGVFDDSPAAKAGLSKGDVLVELGGRPVSDLATFTRALRSHQPGALVEITALRDGRTMKFTVVLGDRADRK